MILAIWERKNVLKFKELNQCCVMDGNICRNNESVTSFLFKCIYIILLFYYLLLVNYCFLPNRIYGKNNYSIRHYIITVYFYNFSMLALFIIVPNNIYAKIIVLPIT